MTRDEFLNYFEPAVQALDLVNSKEMLLHVPHMRQHMSYRKLDQLLGIEEWSLYTSREFSEDTPMPEELKSLLIKLCGPHAKTILKAYKAQRS